MKKLLLLALYSFFVIAAVKANPIDSLKQKLQLTTDDSTKAIIYSQMAECYLSNINSTNAYTKRVSQENAVNVTMQAMRLYYKHNDTTGLIGSYRNLSIGYRSQRKFAQAKWFILQANTLARQQKSAPDIISTLVDLAAIKMDINDFNLAKRDLKEAHLLAVKNKMIERDSLVKVGFSRLYTVIHVPENENIFTQSNKDLRAELRAMDLLNAKKAVSIKPIIKSFSKKKLLTAANKRTFIPKLQMPVLNWETPSNIMTSDSIKMVSL